MRQSISSSLSPARWTTSLTASPIVRTADLNTSEPYWIHFLEFGIIDRNGNTVYKELPAVREDKNGNCHSIPPDVLHSIAPYPKPFTDIPKFDIEKIKDYLMTGSQLEKRQEILKERQQRAQVIKEYLEKSFDARIFATQKKIMEAKAKEVEGEQADISRLEKDLDDLERTKNEKIKDCENLMIVRNGPVSHIASFFVLPPGDLPELSDFVEVESEEEKDRSEKAAMKIVIEYEKNRGWETEDVSKYKLGFDIRSLSPGDPKTGYRNVRRIEVKGRRKGRNVRLTVNEWLKAKQLRDTYWLYVVWNPTESDYEMIKIPDPAYKLEYAAKEIRSISHYEIDGKEVERVKVL